MKHPDHDTLLKSVLRLLDEQEEEALQDHISQCENCQERIGKIKKDIEIIGSLEPDTGIIDIPLPGPHRNAYIPILKAAALILIGFAIGYGTSILSHGGSVNVIPQQLQTTAPTGTGIQYSSCEPIDLNTRYAPIISDTTAT